MQRSQRKRPTLLKQPAPAMTTSSHVFSGIRRRLELPQLSNARQQILASSVLRVWIRQIGCRLASVGMISCGGELREGTRGLLHVLRGFGRPYDRQPGVGEMVVHISAD